MSYPKCRSVEVINKPARPGSNHKEVNCKEKDLKRIIIEKELKRVLGSDIDVRIKQ
jgi:hypothetical protein